MASPSSMTGQSMPPAATWASIGPFDRQSTSARHKMDTTLPGSSTLCGHKGEGVWRRSASTRRATSTLLSRTDVNRAWALGGGSPLLVEEYEMVLPSDSNCPRMRVKQCPGEVSVTLPPLTWHPCTPRFIRNGRATGPPNRPTGGHLVRSIDGLGPLLTVSG